MRHALALAERAQREDDEIPVGAVVVDAEGRVVGEGWNRNIAESDPSAHAEIVALRRAGQAIGNHRLLGCTLYVTLEPCVMCAGALYWTQVKRLVVGASDEKRGFSRIGQPLLHPKTQLVTGVMATESQQLLLKFFRGLRT